jgi:hypothetical protein
MCYRHSSFVYVDVQLKLSFLQLGSGQYDMQFCRLLAQMVSHFSGLQMHLAYLPSTLRL